MTGKHLEKKVKNYNQIIEENKGTNFYLYYIEKDTDINFENNKKLNAYNIFFKQNFLIDT